MGGFRETRFNCHTTKIISAHFDLWFIKDYRMQSGGMNVEQTFGTKSSVGVEYGAN